MRLFNRSMSLVLVAALLFSMAAVPASAQESNAAVDPGDITVEGTNGVGTLISQEIQEEQEMEEAAGDYNVIGLTVEGNVATVEYASMEEATVIVGIYTEDGMQLLGSGYATADPAEKEVAVTVTGEMPEYFIARAYLVDTYDMSPLCTAYSNPMYTREMQELLASTVDDYDPNLVLKLEENATKTNFAVYQESVIVLKAVTGVNTVVSADNESLTYVLSHIDATVSGLQPGNILAYAYEENQILIVKVASIAIDGTTATITGADMDISEVFSHMKLESTGESQQMTVEEGTGDEGITYEGIVVDDGFLGVQPAAYDEEVTLKHSLKFGVDKKIAEGVKVEGAFELSINAKFSYYISLKRQFVELKLTIGAELSAAVEGKAEASLLKLPSFGFMPIPAVFIGFEPELKVEFTVTVTLSVGVEFTCGFKFDDDGFKSLDSNGEVKLAVKGEGKFFIGIDLGPHIAILGGTVAKVKLSATSGFETKFTMTGEDLEFSASTEDAKEKHLCGLCLDATIYSVASAGVELSFLNCKYLTFNWELAAKRKLLGVLYYSFEYGDLGWGECPHKEYRVTVGLKDKDEKNAKDIEVFEGENSLGKTNNKGVVVTYLPKGTYTFSATINETPVSSEKEIDRARKLTMYESGKHLHSGIQFALGQIQAELIKDYTTLASGSCGEGLQWRLFRGGQMVVSGKGDMYFTEDSDFWDDYKDKITSLEVEEGVTSISSGAFSGCSNLETVVLPDTLTSIGSDAFRNCTKLHSVKLPVDATTINAFPGCTNVKAIHYTYGSTGIMVDRTTASGSTGIYGYLNMEKMLEYQCRNSLETVVYEDEITQISNFAAYEASKLYSVYLPECLELIGANAFAGCTSLSTLELPEELTQLGNGAFYGCTGLTKLSFPETLTTIGSSAFAGCTGLASLTIPETVTSVGSEAFGYCTGLTHITWPVDMSTHYVFMGCTNVTSIRYTYGNTGIMAERYTASGSTGIYGHMNQERMLEYICRDSLKSVVFDDDITTISQLAFEGSPKLTVVYLPDSLETIGSSAFAGCTGLVMIELTDGLQTIGSGAFSGCKTLEAIRFPASLTRIDSNAFQNCTALTTLVIPKTVTVLGSGAFSGCTSLLSVTLPVEYSTYGVFMDCSNVTSIHYTYGSTGIMADRYTASGSTGIYGHMNMERMLEYQCREKLESVSFDDSITKISNLAFYQCTALTEVKLPASLEVIGSSAFNGCTALASVTLPEWIQEIGSGAFSGCTALQEIQFPASLTRIDSNAFQGCTGLTEMEIPKTVTALGSGAFSGCLSLRSVTLPVEYSTYGVFMDCSNVTSIHYTYGSTGIMADRYTASGSTGIYGHMNMERMLEYQCRESLEMVAFDAGVTKVSQLAFYGSTALKAVEFRGDAPSIGGNAFYQCTATVFYPVNNATWTDAVMQSYGGSLTWESYTPPEPMSLEPMAEAPAEAQPEVLAEPQPEALAEPQSEAPAELCLTQLTEEELHADKPAAYAVVGGAYETEFFDTYTRKTATFTGLTAGKEYLLLVVADIKAAEPLAASNLLYISQGAADEAGELVFQYIQRVETDISYVMACGASDKDLQDAQITFPNMVADGELQAVEPVVVYDGTTLTEEADYVVVGTVDYTTAGTYTCYIRGIRNYTGLVKCTYTVESAVPAEPAKFASVSMNLGNSLTMYFKLNAADVPEGCKAVITKNYADGREPVVTEIAQSEWLVEGELYSIPVNNIAAKEMSDIVSVVIQDRSGNAISEVKNSSVRAYAMMTLNTSSDAKLLTLMAELLNYGAAAQQQFNYGTSDLANAKMNATHQSYATADTSILAPKANRGDAVKVQSFNMVLESSLLLNLKYYPADVTENMTAKVSYTTHAGTAVSYEIPGSAFEMGTDGYLWVSLDRLAAADINTVATVEIVSNGEVISTTQINMAVAVAIDNGTTPAMTAMSRYCVAAYNFFH